MADLGQNRHFFPAIIIPSKVYMTGLRYAGHYDLRHEQKIIQEITPNFIKLQHKITPVKLSSKI